ncbi:MAG: beta-lactamase family protein [Verrucomicrobia bacterium]|nr:beta-lactamase family protein [Verrucomicrobiota bacterium]
MNPRHLLPALLLAASCFTALAAPDFARAGVDEAKLREIPRRMQKFVDDSVVSGAVTLVARRGQVVGVEALGYADLASKRPMRAEDIFWIASMTKPITGVAVLMLQDDGKLSIEDPVEKHLPEFKGLWLVASRTNDAATLKRPHRKITLRDLLTHTAGLNTETPDVGRDLSLAERTLFYSQQPLAFEPGSRWQYSNPGINALGRIVEVVAQKDFASFLDDRLFKPLGMKDTTFWPTESQAKRVATPYAPGDRAKQEPPLVPTDFFFLDGRPLTARWRSPKPAGGLYSTAADVAKFYNMMLNHGSAGGRQYLKPETAKLMTTTQTGDIKTGFTEGMSWGLGFQVVKQPTGVTAMLAPGTFGHGGAYGTQSWADPQSQMVFVLMIQRQRLANADASDIRRTFQEAAVAAVVK